MGKLEKGDQRVRRCANCGFDISLKNRNAKFCTARCWNEFNREKIRENNRRCYHAHAENRRKVDKVRAQNYRLNNPEKIFETRQRDKPAANVRAKAYYYRLKEKAELLDKILAMTAGEFITYQLQRQQEET